MMIILALNIKHVQCTSTSHAKYFYVQLKPGSGRHFGTLFLKNPVYLLHKGARCGDSAIPKHPLHQWGTSGLVA